MYHNEKHCPDGTCLYLIVLVQASFCFPLFILLSQYFFLLLQSIENMNLSLANTQIPDAVSINAITKKVHKDPGLLR